MVLQCSKVFQWKVLTGLLRQDSQCSYSFGKIQNVGDQEARTFWIEFYCFRERFKIRELYIYIHIYIYIYIYIYMYGYIYTYIYIYHIYIIYIIYISYKSYIYHIYYIYINIYLYIYIYIYIYYDGSGKITSEKTILINWLINLHLIYHRIYWKNLTSSISNTAVNLTGKNALKKADGCLRWKCICLTFLFV